MVSRVYDLQWCQVGDLTPLHTKLNHFVQAGKVYATYSTAPIRQPTHS